MASFFRKRIAQRVLHLLQKRDELASPAFPSLLSPLIKVNRHKSIEPELVLSWSQIEKICNKPLSISPNEFVRLLRNQGLPTAEGFVDIKLCEAPPLSLVFSVDKHIFSKIVLVNIHNNENDFAKSSCFFEDIEKKNIVVQCSAPFFGEFFHMTQLRTVIHSNFVANINKFAGHNVKKIAHVNDWGLHAAIFLTGYKQFKAGKMAFKRDDSVLPEISKAAMMQYNNNMQFKLEADAHYEKMKQGDVCSIAEWEELKERCMEYYGSVYKRIGIDFDFLHFDSTCFHKTEELSRQMLNCDIFQKNEDSTNLSYDENEDNTCFKDNPSDLVIYNLSRHVNAITQMKECYNFDRMYQVGPSSLQDFFSTLDHLAKQLNYDWADELEYVDLRLITSFNSNRFKKLSIETLLNQIKSGMAAILQEQFQTELNEDLQEMAESLSVSSLIINDFKQKKKMDYTFEWKDVISFKKDTGASLQLCLAGLKRLQEDSEYIFKPDIDTSTLLEPGAHYLIQHLARFDEMVYRSYVYLEPSFLYQYLCSLWFLTDKITDKIIIKLDLKHERLIVIKARLMLLSCSLKVLNKGLELLGITPLEKTYVEKQPFVQNS